MGLEYSGRVVAFIVRATQGRRHFAPEVNVRAQTRAPALRGPCPNRLDERAWWKEYRSSRSSGVQVEFRGPYFGKTSWLAMSWLRIGEA